MDKLLTPQETADLTRLSPNTLSWMRHTKTTGPAWGKLGRRVFYKEKDVIAWIDAQFQNNAG